MSDGVKIVLMIAGLAVFILSLAGMRGCMDAVELIESTPPGAMPRTGPPLITLAEFNQISTGMSYMDVARVVGGQGIMQSENTIGAPGDQFYVHTVAYSFMNPGGSNAMIMFQNDKMNMKSQFGLQ